MPSASAALRPARPDAVARRSYLQRIAEPLRPGDPVLFAVPRPPPGEARAAVEMPPTPRPAAALHAPAHSPRAEARLAPATSPNAAHKPAPAEAAAESTLAPTENAAASGELPPASSSARTSLQPAPAPREPAPDMIARARLVTIEPEAPGEPLLSTSSSGSAPAPRIHIGTVEVRSAAPPAPARPAARVLPRTDAAPISRGYAWRFGLVQG